MQSEPDKNGNPIAPGTLAVLDARTGRVRRVMSLPDTVGGAAGQRAYEVAVDTRTRRVFALADAKVVVLDATRL